MRRWPRRRWLIAAGAGAAGLAGLRAFGPRLLRPDPPARVPAGEVAEFVKRCFAGLDRSSLWDSHVHVAGIGTGGSGCWVRPEMKSQLHPLQRLRYDLYRSAVGIEDDATADADYVARLLELQRLANPDGRLVLFAFDMAVDENGRERPDLSTFYVPDDYVLTLARRHREFEACVSIHPYRADALDRLERAARQGAVAVKWLPNTMGIDPASPRCDGFYRRLAEWRIPLISHAGAEWTVPSHFQSLGNPLRLRRALDAGVVVVVAHCASFGDDVDLDRPDGGRNRLPAFDLFLRMLGEPQYRPTLFGDISALIQVNRSGRPLREMLRRSEYHARLVNGSDYPLPEMAPWLGAAKLRAEGLLSPEDHRMCSAVRRGNPLLYDFVLKRCLAWEKDGVTHRFSPAIFESARIFRP